jgi:hypothetical protein
MSITTPKSASIAALLAQISELTGVASEDLYVADIWKFGVHNVFEPKDPVGGIKDDIDDIYVFELDTNDSVRGRYHCIEQEQATKRKRDFPNATEDGAEPSDPNNTTPKNESYWLQLEKARRANYDDETQWINLICVHTSQVIFNRLTNIKRSTYEERLDFLMKLNKYVKTEMERLASTEESMDDDGQSAAPKISAAKIGLGSLHGVSTMEEALILDYCGEKFRQWNETMQLELLKGLQDGIVVTFIISGEGGKAFQPGRFRETSIATPFVMRIPSNMSIYGLRQELGHRLSRVLHFQSLDLQKFDSPKSSAAPAHTQSGTMNGELPMSEEEESDSLPLPPPEDIGDGEDPRSLMASKMKKSKLSNDDEGDNMVADVEKDDNEDDNKKDWLKVLERVPLTFQNSTHAKVQKIGSFDQERVSAAHNNDIVAKSSDKAERMILSEMSGSAQGGTGPMITLQFCTPRLSACFNFKEWETSEEKPQTEKDDEEEKKTDVLDCINKYCQTEQLEESEMWYCNRCKTHVRAWKHIGIFRAPPILIIQLKRFTFSATTHRRDKISLNVDFPLKGLDLQTYVLHWDEGEEPIYDCFAVSNHYGGLGGGHYTAYALNHGTWCYFDDSSVKEDVSEAEVVSNAAYVLYYRRRDITVPTVEREEITSTTILDDDDDKPAAMVVDEDTASTWTSSQATPPQQRSHAIPFASQSGTNVATDESDIDESIGGDDENKADDDNHV